MTYLVIGEYMNYNRSEDTISSPDLNDVVDWLREKGVIISVGPAWSKYTFVGEKIMVVNAHYKCNIVFNNIPVLYHDINKWCNNLKFHDYYEALEACIDKTLNFYIENVLNKNRQED
jgi:hypothetical protein